MKVNYRPLLVNYFEGCGLKHDARLNVAHLIIDSYHDNDRSFIDEHISNGVHSNYLFIPSMVSAMNENTELCDSIFDNIEIHKNFHFNKNLINIYRNCENHDFYLVKKLLHLLIKNNFGLEPFLESNNFSLHDVYAWKELILLSGFLRDDNEDFQQLKVDNPDLDITFKSIMNDGLC